MIKHELPAKYPQPSFQKAIPTPYMMTAVAQDHVYSSISTQAIGTSQDDTYFVVVVVVLGDLVL